jgi:hypothetical protein
LRRVLALFCLLQKRLRLIVHVALHSLRSAHRTITIIIQSVDFVLVEPILSNLHPSGEGSECAQFFDGKSDSLSRCGETPVFGVAASALRQIQFSR